MKMLHPWHGVSCGENAPDIVTAVIEVPKGSQTKYELDKLSGLLKVVRQTLIQAFFVSFFQLLASGFLVVAAA